MQKRHRLGVKLDDVIVRLIEEECDSIFGQKWQSFLRKHRNIHGVELVDKFQETLSSKSFPTGVSPKVKAQVEKMLTDGRIEGLTAIDIPKSGVWMNNKIRTLKAEGKLSIIKLRDTFLAKVKKESNISEVPAIVEEEEATFLETDELITQNAEDVMSIGKTLKSICNPDFDYTILRDRLNNQQSMVTAVMYRLSKALKGLIDIILKGGIGRGSRVNLFGDTTAFGFLEIQDEATVYRPNEALLKSIEDEKLFSFSGFNKMMSYCIGEKFKPKHST